MATDHWKCLDQVQNAGERLEPQRKPGSHLYRREKLNKAWRGRAGHKRHRKRSAWDSLVCSWGVRLRWLIKGRVSLGSRVGSTLCPAGCSWFATNFFSSQFSHLKNTVDNHSSIRKWRWGLTEMIYAKYLERLVPSTPAQVLAISGPARTVGREAASRRDEWGTAGEEEALRTSRKAWSGASDAPAGKVRPGLKCFHRI